MFANASTDSGSAPVYMPTGDDTGAAKYESVPMAAMGRSSFYWWLAGWVLKAPEAPDVAALRAGMSVDTLADTEIGERLREFCESTGTAPASDVAQALGPEYSRLMSGVQQGRGPNPPFEAVWREQRLLGESTVAVLQAYADAGFQDIDPAAGPQDHLGVELKFMALLALKEHDAALSGDTGAVRTRQEQQAAFLRRHLLAWAPHWADEVAHQAREPFFARLAGLIRAFITQDADYVQRAVLDPGVR